MLAEKRGGRVTMVGHLLHCHPTYLSLEQTVADSMLGRRQYIHFNRLNLGKGRQ